MRSLRQREDLAEAMTAVALRMAAAVHDDGPTEVAAILATVDPADLDALAVVTAAMVPVDRTPAELLDWLDQATVRPPSAEPRTARDLPAVSELGWTATQLRWAHTAYKRGDRDPRICAGNQIYETAIKAGQRLHRRPA